MAQFSYADYQNSVNSTSQTTKTQNAKVGWFKLADDQDEALVRINLSSIEDLQFATIHQLGASTKWMKVSCLNDFGSYENVCPLCKAASEGNTAIGKADKRVYIPMLVRYRDKTSGQWAAVQPVIWDRKAGFSREIANKLRDYGNLKQVLFKITRNGAKGDMKTTYSIEYAMPNIFKPELIPEDFSAFDNFRLDKHSFWIKSKEDVNTFLTTGVFPTPVQQAAPAQQTYTQPVQAAPAPQPVYQAPATPIVESAPWEVTPQAPATPVQPEPQPTPKHNFSGFSF